LLDELNLPEHLYRFWKRYLTEIGYVEG